MQNPNAAAGGANDGSTNKIAEFDSKTHRIITDKELNGFRWFIITYKDISDYEINFANCFWICGDLIKDKLETFNEFLSEEKKNKEMKDLYIVQEELLKKLSGKEEDMIKLRNEKENLVKKAKINSQNLDIVNNPGNVRKFFFFILFF